jgi:hypothetical protein
MVSSSKLLPSRLLRKVKGAESELEKQFASLSYQSIAGKQTISLIDPVMSVMVMLRQLVAFPGTRIGERFPRLRYKLPVVAVRA